jgi:hypothetical protein
VAIVYMLNVFTSHGHSKLSHSAVKFPTPYVIDLSQTLKLWVTFILLNESSLLLYTIILNFLNVYILILVNFVVDCMLCCSGLIV